MEQIFKYFEKFEQWLKVVFDKKHKHTVGFNKITKYTLFAIVSYAFADMLGAITAVLFGSTFGILLEIGIIVYATWCFYVVCLTCNNIIDELSNAIYTTDIEIKYINGDTLKYFSVVRDSDFEKSMPSDLDLIRKTLDLEHLKFNAKDIKSLHVNCRVSMVHPIPVKLMNETRLIHTFTEPQEIADILSSDSENS